MLACRELDVVLNCSYGLIKSGCGQEAARIIATRKMQITVKRVAAIINCTIGQLFIAL